MSSKSPPLLSHIFSPFYQSVFIINNQSLLPGQHPLILDYNVSSDSTFGPDYDCSNCACYGFPCANCQQYVINGEPLVSKLNTEFLIDFSDDDDVNTNDTSASLCESFSTISFLSQIELIAAGKISWADVPLDDDDLCK